MYGIAPDNFNVEGFAGKKSAIPMYIQFVTGYCSDVCHSSENIFHDASNHTNTIMAVPHQTNKKFKMQNTSVDDEDRYFPLLRTMHDVPTKGDPVLLTNLGGVNYYLGPLNMPKNSPTWNEDNNYLGRDSLVVKTDSGETTPREARGESPNFNKNNNYLRLIKRRNEELDGYAPALNETTGDTLIEGRHGNSVRIGSRSDNPYIFISNERAPGNDIEQLVDGSLITISSNGTLAQHFGETMLNIEQELIEFKLSSDLKAGSIESNFTIGNIYRDLNNGIDPIEIYRYGSKDSGEVSDSGEPIYEASKGNQVLLHSDRITLNSKLDDIFVSSIKDVHIGSGRFLTLSTAEDLVINSNRTFLGSPKPNNQDRTETMEPMVLGQILSETLTEMLDLIQNLEVFTGQAGVQTPLKSPTATAILGPKVDSIEAKIARILSNKHFIEPNP